MNFDYKDWLNCNYKNIEFAYETDNFFSILYLFMWKLTKLNNVVYVCKNCGKYFIPDFQYNSKYCNNIYSDNKNQKVLFCLSYLDKQNLCLLALSE